MSSSPLGSPLLDMAHDLHDKFNKFMSMIPGHVPPEAPAPHEQAIADMNKAANDQTVQAANQSFVNDAAAANVRSRVAQKMK